MNKVEPDKQLFEDLQADVDRISRGLLSAFDISFSGSRSDLGAATSRWLDFRFRYIEPCPREIFLSDMFPKALPENAVRGFRSLLEKFSRGHDVNPYQSKTLTGYRRPPGRSQPRFRTDMLFADWGISHFHLTDTPLSQGARFSERSDWLAFCFVASQQVAVIDVVPHPDHAGLAFADPDLMGTAIRCWPESFEKFRVRGISHNAQMTMGDIHALRSNSTNAFFNFEEHSYIGPGGGYMGDKTLAEAYRRSMVLIDDVESLVNPMVDPCGQFLGNVYVQVVDNPRFSLKIHEHGIGVYEEISRVLFKSSAEDGGEDVFGLWRMSELILPRWAMRRVLNLKDTTFNDLFCEPVVDVG